MPYWKKIYKNKNDNELEYFTVYTKFYLSVYIYDNTKNANKLNVG